MLQKIGFYLFTLFLIACSSSKENSDTLIIASAANMQYAMKPLVKAFTNKTGINCEVVFGSSGKLTAQIKAGAPYSVFVSADTKYPKKLYSEGFSINPPQVYANGKLVLWTSNKEINPSLEVLKTEKVKHIAIANPKIAPYGKAAVEVLDAYKLTKHLASKFVFGESISQVNQFVNSQAADIGFTAMAVVIAPEIKGKGKWIAVDENLYAPIEQSIVLIKKDKGAKQFYDFMFSNEAKQIMVNFGYSINE